MKFLIAGAVALFGATAAQAAVISGLSDVTDNGGGSYTFTFDTVTSDIDGTGMGLGFTGGGISFVASSSQGIVRQDFPAHGGLGVLGGPGGGTDNLELGLGETLKLVFSQSVEIMNWTFNGLGSGDGHQDAADGRVRATVDGTSLNSLTTDAHFHDGVGTDFVPTNTSSICQANSNFCSTTTLLFSADSASVTNFKGYLESVTIRVGPAPVPVPASLGLLLAGLGGLGAFARKGRKT